MLGDFGDEELIGVEIVKPAVHNGDRASAVVALRWMPAPRRPAIQAKGIHPPWPDPDPSRGIVEHGSGDFARRAWHVPAELPDSGAELPFAARGGRLARMFRGSTFGLDRTADKRGPDSGSARKETSCKSRHRHMCIADASNSRHLCLAFETMFSAPPSADDAILAGPPESTSRGRAPVWRRDALWICGQRKGVAHIPTGPATTASFNSMI